MIDQSIWLPTYVIPGLISVVVAMLSSGVTRLLLHNSAVKIQRRKETRDKLDVLFKQVREFRELCFRYWTIDATSDHSPELEGAILVRQEDFQSGIALLKEATSGKLDLETQGLNLKRHATGGEFKSSSRRSSEVTVQFIFEDVQRLEREGERQFRAIYK